MLALINVGVYLWLSGPGKLGFERGPAPQPAINAPGMRLLTEEPRIADPAASTLGLICVRVGPFVSVDGASRARRILDVLELRYRTQTIGEREIRAYRVYIGPFDSLTAAQPMRNRLRSKQIEHYALTEPSARTTISLGLFSSQATAERYIAEVAEQGIEAQSRQEYRKIGATHWLEVRDLKVDSDPRRRLEATDWRESVARVRRIPCL